MAKLFSKATWKSKKIKLSAAKIFFKKQKSGQAVLLVAPKKIFILCFVI